MPQLRSTIYNVYDNTLPPYETIEVYNLKKKEL
jgi:hypothetical protein